MTRSPLLRPLLWTGLHAILWSIFLGGMLTFVPRFDHLFTDFGVDMPVLGLLVTRSSRVLAEGMIPAALGLAVVLAIDFGVLRALSGSPGDRTKTIGWIVTMAALPLVLTVGALATICVIWFDMVARLQG